MGSHIELLNPYKPLFKKPKNRYFLITGSRGSAKSFHVAYFLIWLTYEPGHVILYTRYTMVASHISIIPEFLEKMDLLNSRSNFEVTKTEIINKKTGSKILFRGIKTSSGNQTASLKSIQGVTTYVQEEAEELVEENIFDTIDLSIRHKTLDNRVIIVMNPSTRDHFIYKRFIANEDNNCVHIHTTYLDNIKNLSDSFIEQAERTKKVNFARYEHIFLGTWADVSEGLLWNHDIISSNRVNFAPILVRKIVAIDPAISATAKSDETGIVVLGVCSKGDVYVLEDVSGVYSPNEWAQVAKDCAVAHNCDCYVAESNQGGDMVSSNLKSVDPLRRVKLVRATRGKHTRAEPVYGMYEQGRVKHVGYFSKLESQMVSWNPTDQTKSPDRVDALVWGVTDLILSNNAIGTSSSGKKPRHEPRRL